MGWADFLTPEGGDEQVLPWTGGRTVTDGQRTWRIQGRRPDEHGWYTFRTSGGRKASLVGPADINLEFEDGRPLIKGYLVGERLIPDDARVDPNPDKLVEQTEPVYIVEPGLDRFTRATAVRVGEDLIYLRMEFPDGPEAEALAAYQDRKDSIGGISGVSPALDLAFRWISHQRVQAEIRRVEMERLRVEEEARLAVEERRQQAMKDIGTGLGRRKVAEHDFDTAAKAALALSGAELLDTRHVTVGSSTPTEPLRTRPCRSGRAVSISLPAAGLQRPAGNAVRSPGPRAPVMWPRCFAAWDGPRSMGARSRAGKLPGSHQEGGRPPCTLITSPPSP